MPTLKVNRLLVRNISVVGVGWGGINAVPGSATAWGELVFLGLRPPPPQRYRCQAYRPRCRVWTTAVCSAGCEPKRMLAIRRYGDAVDRRANARGIRTRFAGVTNATLAAIGYPIARWPASCWRYRPSKAQPA